MEWQLEWKQSPQKYPRIKHFGDRWGFFGFGLPPFLAQPPMWMQFSRKRDKIGRTDAPLILASKFESVQEPVFTHQFTIML